MLKLLPFTLLILSSCAVGSGMSGASAISYYSIECGKANHLSQEAETALIYKIKKELSEGE